MRTRNKVVLGAIGGLIVLSAIGSAVDDAPPTAPSVTATPATAAGAGGHLVTVPPRDPAATQRPTQRPTPTEDSGAEAYEEFRLHVTLDMVPRATEALGLITDAAASNDVDETALALTAYSMFLLNEKVWLDTHPPAPCYRDVHRLIGEGLALQEEGAELMRSYFLGTGTEDDFVAGTELFERGSDSVERATAANEEVDCS